MKAVIALALLACVAVSHAAFTNTLQQRTQPLVNQAMFKLQMSNGRSQIGQLLASLFPQQIADLQDAIAHHTATAQAMGANLLNTLQGVAEALHTQVSSLIEDLPQPIRDLLQGLLAGNNGKASVSEIVTAVQTHIQNTQTAISAILAQAHLLANQLTMENLLNWAAGQLGLQSRGMFSNIWGAITGAVGNAWDTVTDHASAAWDSATTQALDAWNQMYGTATAVAGHTMDTVSAMANAFIDDAQENISSMSAQAALQFQDMMSNWSAQLPGQWDQIQQQVAAIVAADNKPTGRRF